MKKIEANIKPFRLKEVRQALNQVGIETMTVSEVREYGRTNVHTEIFRGNEYSVEHQPRIKIELIVPNDCLDEAIDAVLTGETPSNACKSNLLIFNIEDQIGNSAGQFAIHTN
ncbi:MAG TPA: P-II family nitrogen regulator [Verrucomicrobiae bacterium]|jgi:nitrogen regulatory protein P-II 1